MERGQIFLQKSQRTRTFFPNALPSSNFGGAKRPGIEKKELKDKGNVKFEAILHHRRLARDSGKGVPSEHTCNGHSLSPLSLNTLPPSNPCQQQEQEWRQSHGQQNVSAKVEVGRKEAGDGVQYHDTVKSVGLVVI